MTDKLQEALAKGDVVELEEAIAATQVGLRALARRNAGRVVAELQDRVLAKARHVLAQHLELCRPYLKPLRRACRQRDERAISEALLWAQGAPPQVQLYMYTDLMRAEAARDELRRLRKEAAAILVGESCADIDDFLSRRADLLDDRTILKLVQRREELLRRGRHVRPSGERQTEPYTQGRPHIVDVDIVTKEPPRRLAPRLVDLHHGPYATGVARDAIMGEHSTTPRRAFIEPTTTRPPRWSATADSAAATSANNNNTAASHSVASGPARRLEHLEMQQRAALSADELQSRVTLYEMAMEAAASATAALTVTTFVGQKGYGGAHNAGRAVHQTALSPQSDTTTQVAGIGAAPRYASDTSVPKTPRASNGAATASRARPQAVASTLPSPSPRLEAWPVADTTAAPAAMPDVTPPRLPLSAVPALRYRTPSVSPIKTGYHGASNVKGMASSSMTTAALEALLTHGEQPSSPPPRPSRDAAPATVVNVPTSAVMMSSLDRKRVAARLRVLSQEEAIHRQDIEGTEDFDRSVFLLPAAARLQLLLLQVQR